MRRRLSWISTLAALGALLPASAWAGDEGPAPTADAATPTPAATPAPAQPEPPAPGPAAAVEATAAPTAWPGWIRVDHDGGGLQVWGGATAPLVDGLGLAFDMYVNSGSLGEFDIGPAITVGTLTLTPMIGAQFNWADKTFAALVPQLYLTGPIGDKLYNELWVQYYNYKLVRDAGADSYLYVREFIDYKLTDFVGIGPQVELTQNFTLKKLTNLPVGGNVMLNMGANSTFFAFLGYETNKNGATVVTGTDAMGGDIVAKHRVAGRLTFVHNF